MALAKKSRLPLTIEGELIAKSTGTVSLYAVGDRVFHLKFGNGNVTHVDGNKLTIAFDRAGEKRVVEVLWSGCEFRDGRSCADRTAVFHVYSGSRLRRRLRRA